MPSLLLGIGFIALGISTLFGCLHIATRLDAKMPGRERSATADNLALVGMVVCFLCIIAATITIKIGG